MIRYSLHCDHGHEFEGWFSSSADFDSQMDRGLVTCPFCESRNIGKLLMAPNVATARKKDETKAHVAGAVRAEMMVKLREVVSEIRSRSDDVGDRFPEEARKIHYGETEARGIMGRASLEEAAALVEEGIEIAPLPDLPEDIN